MISAYPQNNPYGNAWWGIYPPGPAMNPAMVASQPAQQANPIQQQAPAQQTGGIDGVAFVQGENAALAFVVPNGKTFLLIDTIEDRIYFKSADAYGRPSPLNDFWLTKNKPEPAPAPAQAEEPDPPEYATKAELDEIREQVAELKAKRTAGRRQKPEPAEETEVDE